jgi:regulator of protease activity HflC (stomatin/prohibitin superfamily)
MSSDWTDTDATWPDASGQEKDAHEIAPLEDQTGQVLVHPDTGSFQPGVGAEESSSDFSLSSSEALGGILRQFSPLFMPLLFGGITFLFILLFVHYNLAAVSTSGLPAGLILLSVGIILLIFAVAQGVMLYYAGSNDVLWAFAALCGFSLFLLTGCFVIFPPFVGVILLVVLLVLGYLLARLCIHLTLEGRVDIIQAFGKHTRTLIPGLYLLAPWERVGYRLSTKETVWTSPKQIVLVSRSEEVHYIATISYRLMPEDAHLAAFYVNDWEKSLQELFVATTQNSIRELSPDDFIAWSQGMYSRQVANADNFSPGQWDRINRLLAQRIQDQVAHWGVQINGVQIRDVIVDPHIPQFVGVNPPASPQPVDARATQNATSATAQPHPAKVNPHPEMTEQVAPAKPSKPAPVSMPAAAPAAKVSKVDILAQAYDDVRSERITDPITIRKIASRFETIANDPEESKNVHFDAARAARTLYARAEIYEKHLAANNDYNDATRPDWSIRRPSEDNLLAGG